MTLTVEYRITMGDGEVFYLTVDVPRDSKLGAHHAHEQAINDGFVQALLLAPKTSWWLPSMTIAEIKFWQTHE